MQIIRQRAYARAGLIGNPSDGYNGKTISIIVKDFRAEVTLYEWDTVEVIAAQEEQPRYRSVQELARDVKLHGYYGGVRLVKATIRRFLEYCQRRGVRLHDRNFSIRYETNIPRQVGLAGSSAIIAATTRALMEFYAVDIPQAAQPSFVLSIENEELGIAGGLQDRVIQIYEGLVFMDFDKAREREIEGFRCYEYEPLDPALLPPVYIAYSTHLAEPTEVFHNDIRGRFNRGEEKVVHAMKRCGELAGLARQAILDRDAERLSQLMNENFEMRRGIYNLPPWQVEMVEVARRCGASAQFAGSGGTIIGTYRDAAMLEDLRKKLGALECRVLVPRVL